MEETTATTSSGEYVDSDPTVYSDELQELIRQGNDMINQSAEILNQSKDTYSVVSQIVELEQAAAERNEAQLGGIIVLVASLGIVCGALFTLLIKVR